MSVQLGKGIKRRREDVSEDEENIRAKANRTEMTCSKQDLFVLLLDEDELYHDLTEANREHLTSLIKGEKYQSVIDFCGDDIGFLKEVCMLAIELEDFALTTVILGVVKSLDG